jgi:hypothetical protein
MQPDVLSRMASYRYHSTPERQTAPPVPPYHTSTTSDINFAAVTIRRHFRDILLRHRIRHISQNCACLPRQRGFRRYLKIRHWHRPLATIVALLGSRASIAVDAAPSTADKAETYRAGVVHDHGQQSVARYKLLAGAAAPPATKQICDSTLGSQHRHDRRQLQISRAAGSRFYVFHRDRIISARD